MRDQPQIEQVHCWIREQCSVGDLINSKQVQTVRSWLTLGGISAALGRLCDLGFLTAIEKINRCIVYRVEKDALTKERPNKREKFKQGITHNSNTPRTRMARFLPGSKMSMSSADTADCRSELKEMRETLIEMALKAEQLLKKLEP